MSILLNEIISNLLVISNIILSLIIASLQMRMLYSCRKHQPKWCFIRVLGMLLAMYWAGLYTFVLIQNPENYNAVVFGQVFVRPAFTLTLALMASMAIFRRRCK